MIDDWLLIIGYSFGLIFLWDKDKKFLTKYFFWKKKYFCGEI